MQKERLTHFKEILLAQLSEHSAHIRDDQAAGLELSDDGVKDSSDLSVMDADIDQALLRIKEGTYGICARCGKPIDERRLEAVPTARYDAECQALLEQARGASEPSL